MGRQLEPFDEKSAGRELVDWYYMFGRPLPWRRTQDPYEILVSEIMLQQTRVEAVEKRYAPFLHRFPTIQVLAASSEDEVFKEWEGLGYYRRARNLHAAAKYICERHDGIIPSDEEQLLAIPGIGSYTASAVRAICFQLPSAALDTNGYKVFARLYALGEPVETAGAKRKMLTWAHKWLPEDVPGDFAQALMDLSAKVCVSPEPRCEKCPINLHCEAYHRGVQNDLPLHKEKKQKHEDRITVLALISGGRVALERQPADGLLAGMYGFPRQHGRLTAKEVRRICSQLGYDVEDIELGPEWKYAFTHLVWHATSYIVHVYAYHSAALVWADAADLESRYAIPTAFSLLAKRVQEELR